jgi:UDP-glucose 4-epimerase
MDKRVTVTGGCGFIGANLVPRLLERGYQVRVLDNLSRGYLEFLNGLDIDFVEGDIRDDSAMNRAARGAAAIIHLAAYGSVIESLTDPITNFDVNGGGTLISLEAAKNANVEKFVFASTGGALIGDAEPPVTEDSVPRPKSPYGASKLTCEGYCQAYAQSFGLSTVMLRFANIYGPFSAHKKGAVTAFCKALMTGDSITIFGDGSASRDFLHVDDLCAGIIRALEHDLEPATVLHLATDRETSVLELAEILRKTAGVPEHPIKFMDSRAGEVHRNFANFERAGAVLGFRPEVTLEEGLQRTWKWFLDQGKRSLEMDANDS